jgi:serine/threonine protein phosphatase PrpC
MSSTVDPVDCPACGSAETDEDGYCTGCGQRQATGADRAVLELATVAGVTDRGVRKRRNEDATAIGELPGTTLVVVCDGVSSSSRADSAAHAAVDAAMPALLDAVTSGTPDTEATVLAAAAAQRAVAATANSSTETNPPSSTYVSAIVRDGAVTLGWIGDSRAYWLPPDLPGTDQAGPEDDGESGIGVLPDGAVLTGPARLTVDDSFAGQLAAAGVPVLEAHADPQAGALVRWLGADADGGPARVATFRPTGPGRLVVCSDGLSRYRPTAAELAASAPAGTPVGTAADLVQLARDHGGVDNITVVLVPYVSTDAHRGGTS